VASLEDEIGSKQQFLSKVRESESAILGFVDCQQKSQMIRLLSEDYKRI
jgi:hypothetical protein